jgi:hypothetical protein
LPTGKRGGSSSIPQSLIVQAASGGTNRAPPGKIKAPLKSKQVEKLLRAGAPGRHFDGQGLYLQIKSKTAARWERRYMLHGQEHYFGLGSAFVFGLAKARERNRELDQLLADGIDPLQQKRAERLEQALQPAKSLHERVARKFADFQERGIEPEAYLYRHYEPNGDLLYAGITLSIPDRTSKHLAESRWREMICLIVIEPFATREEVLAEEEIVIRTEFPKYNRALNGNRHPMQELARLDKRKQAGLRKLAARASPEQLIKIRREYKNRTSAEERMARL